jgi:hypothetical protein
MITNFASEIGIIAASCGVLLGVLKLSDRYLNKLKPDNLPDNLPERTPTDTIVEGAVEASFLTSMSPVVEDEASATIAEGSEVITTLAEKALHAGEQILQVLSHHPH